jgi:hypothetical protein
MKTPPRKPLPPSGQTTSRRPTVRRRIPDFSPSVPKAMARLTDCLLCGKPFGNTKGVTEHCHYTGKFRGKTCHRCNVVDGVAVKKARKAFGISKNDYETTKPPLSRRFWTCYARELASRIDGLRVSQARSYVTGRYWEKVIRPLII